MRSVSQAAELATTWQAEGRDRRALTPFEGGCTLISAGQLSGGQLPPWCECGGRGVVAWVERRASGGWLRLSRVAAVSLVVAGTFVGTLAVSVPPAAATGTCPDSPGVHEYSHQYVSGGTWDGEYGNYYTYNPTVQDDSTDFSVSHLYVEYAYGTLPFVEVGWYKGEGAQHNVSTPHYYTVWGSKYSSYNENDSTDYPNLDSYRLYELLYVGEDYNTGKAIWNFYWYTLSSPAFSVEITGLFGGQPLAGAEVASSIGDAVEAHVHGEPNFQLLDQSGSWDDWTTSIGTDTCTDPGLTLTETTKYQDFTMSGNL
jgi:hypothetical protein